MPLYFQMRISGFEKAIPMLTQPATNDIKGEPLSEQDAQEIGGLHYVCMRSGMSIRDLDKRQVSRVTYDNRSYIVKAFLLSWYQRLFPFLLRQEANSRVLRGLTPPCLASYRKNNWQMLIFPDAGPVNFYEPQQLLETGLDLQELYGHAGMLLARMHNRNIFHGDTKPPNFVVNSLLPDLPRVVIVDCDRVRKYHRIPLYRRAFNIAQFLAGSRVFPEHQGLLENCLAGFLSAYGENVRNQQLDLGDLFQLSFQMALDHRKIEHRLPPEILESLTTHHD